MEEGQPSCRNVVNLRYSVNPLPNASALFSLFSSAAALATDVRSRKGHNFTVSYLVDSLGLT